MTANYSPNRETDVPAMEEKENAVGLEKPPLPNLDHLLNDIARQITDSGIDIPSHFSFIWHKIHFVGQILPQGQDNRFSLNLVASLGYIPFSAEDKSYRKKLLDLFTPLFMSGDYTLSVNSQIQMIILTGFVGPVNARRLVEAITFTLLDLQPDLTSVQASMVA
ncbi:MAG: hypothetical protein GXP02_10325 [Alphaproteobacteria bacterium]|nr:hypothetical protein [Alphaproteobacteria bacterium]